MRNGRRKWLAAAAALGLGLGAVAWLTQRTQPPHAVGGAPAPARPAPEQMAPDAAAARLATETDPAARRKLVRALAAAPDAVPRLKAVFDGSTDGASREEALIQASRLGGADAARWLADVTGKSPGFGGRAGAALGAMTSPAAAPELARIARSDAPVLVRANAAQALGRSEARAQAGDALALAVSPEQPLRVRQEAADALARIGDDSQVARLGASLDAALDDRSFNGEQLRIGFVRALGGIGSAAAREILLRHAQRDLSRNERAFVETALAFPGSAESGARAGDAGKEKKGQPGR